MFLHTTQSRFLRESMGISHRSTPSLDEWTAVIVDDVGTSIGVALRNTCQLDAAPQWLVKDMRGHLSPFISNHSVQ